MREGGEDRIVIPEKSGIHLGRGVPEGVKYHEIVYRLCQDIRYSLVISCLPNKGGKYAVERAECHG